MLVNTRDFFKFSSRGKLTSYDMHAFLAIKRDFSFLKNRKTNMFVDYFYYKRLKNVFDVSYVKNDISKVPYFKSFIKRIIYLENKIEKIIKKIENTNKNNKDCSGLVQKFDVLVSYYTELVLKYDSLDELKNKLSESKIELVSNKQR